MGGLEEWVNRGVLTVRNEGYIFIRGSTSITWDMVSGQTDGMGGWVD